MKKEALLAILVGAVIGIIIAYGIYTANQAVKETKTKQTVSQATATPSPQPASEPSLVVNEPENNIVFSLPEATISGQTSPQAIVAVLAENQEKLLMADQEGLFSTRINLIKGINEIKVVSIAPNKAARAEKIMEIVYSTAKIE